MLEPRQQQRHREPIIRREDRRLLALLKGLVDRIDTLESDIITTNSLIVGSGLGPIMVDGNFHLGATADIEWSGVTIYASGNAHSVTDGSFDGARDNEYFVYWDGEGWTDDDGLGSSTLTVTNSVSNLVNDQENHNLIGVYDTRVSHDVADADASGAWYPLWMGGTVIDGNRIHTGSIIANSIAAQAITTSKIQLGAVTETIIATDAVTGDKIATNAVTETKITAGAVTTSRLDSRAGTGGALNRDPTCSDINAWGAPAGASVVTLTDGRVGATALQATGSALSDLFSATDVVLTQTPVDPNKTYRAHVWAREISGTRTNLLIMDFIDKDGVHIDGINGLGWPAVGTYFYWGIDNPDVFPSTFTEYQITFGKDGTARIPAAAVTMRIGVYALYTGSGSATVQFQDFRIEDVLDGRRITSLRTDELTGVEQIPLNGMVLHSSGLQGFVSGERTIFLDANTGDTILGEVAANKNNLFYDASAGTLQLRTDTTPIIDINTTTSEITVGITAQSSGNIVLGADDILMRSGTTIVASLTRDTQSASRAPIFELMGTNAAEAAEAIPTGALPGFAGIYCRNPNVDSGYELYSIDDQGNSTLQTPHNENDQWIFHSRNNQTGKVVYIEMEQLIKKLNDKFGEEDWFQEYYEG